MSAAIDTNVLVRMLIQDSAAPAQSAVARRLAKDTEAASETLLVALSVLLEAEWVLRSRYKVDRTSMTAAIVAMLEAPGIEFEHQATVEEALSLFETHPSADFADCLHIARATHLGCGRFLTFDARAAKLPRTELLV